MGNRTDELQGHIKQGLGRLTGNEEMERDGSGQVEKARVQRQAEGAVDKAAGTVEEAVGDVAGDTETELKGKARQVEGDVKRAG